MSQDASKLPRKYFPINLNESDIVRFWEKVEKKSEQECWPWKGGKFHGYGAFKLNKKTVKAQRVAWVIANGAIPEGMIVCHKCDFRECTNIDHLFLGSHQDNMDDMIAKNRSLTGDKNPMRKYPEKVTRGEAHPSSRLTPEKVLAIRKSFADGLGTLTSLGRDHNVTKQSIYAIVLRKSWTHI